jgi:hypothetical protein
MYSYNFDFIDFSVKLLLSPILFQTVLEIYGFCQCKRFRKIEQVLHVYKWLITLSCYDVIRRVLINDIDI